MAEEKELLTILTKTEFDAVLKRLTKEFGKPEIVKRLALQCTDYRWADVDTRIRVTNGKAEIMQKLGDWKNYSREELKIEIPTDTQIIFDLYKVFRNMMKNDEVLVPIMQYENRVWKTRDFEIKLTYQFGKTDAYNCEIEVMDTKINPEVVANDLKIPIHLAGQTQDFWKEWNEKINLNAKELPDSKLMEIIQKYV